jgi:hypothetical protein
MAALIQSSGSVNEMVKVFEMAQKNYMEQCKYFYQYGTLSEIERIPGRRNHG